MFYHHDLLHLSANIVNLLKIYTFCTKMYIFIIFKCICFAMINKVEIYCHFLLMYLFQTTNSKSITYLLKLGRECRILFMCFIFSCGETLISLTGFLSAPTHSSRELIWYVNLGTGTEHVSLIVFLIFSSAKSMCSWA